MALDPVARTPENRSTRPESQTSINTWYVRRRESESGARHDANGANTGELISRRNAKPQVLIVDAKNKVHFRSVKLGDDLGKQVEIADGIANGTRVIINPSDTLTEGDPVTISTTGE